MARAFALALGNDRRSAAFIGPRVHKRSVHKLFLQKLLSLCLAGLLAASTAAAEGDPPPLSAFCQAPAGDISSPGRLPRLAAAIESRKPIRVLAIGASIFAIGGTRARGAYQSKLKNILEKVFRGRQIVIVDRGVRARSRRRRRNA